MRPDDTAPEHAPAQDAARVQELLAAHVPLTLIADLTASTAVASQDLLEKEGLPEEAWWEGSDGPSQASGAPRP
ncbi:hypothetical protein [Cellulomonas biazotea]|jgi:hypothetical protein|uniref:Uncharacterized protein n=1 Tax=Cellulomonas biazotea TaxID=1709 RepID=A0A402DPG2_9CELL|nr:hypothetical protein [Cellulomonas biazotea]GCE76042.1 hypothetical protein CBZ_10980 [Cellulomonas biazotea]